jgi:two-component system sensor histidine kinase ArlS
MDTCWRVKTVKLKIGVFKKISWKLTIIYALIFSLVLVLLNAGTLIGVRYFLIQQARVQVGNTMSSTMDDLSSPRKEANLSDPDILSDAQPVGEMNIKLTDAQGKMINSTDRFGLNDIEATSDMGVTTVIESKGRHLIVRNEAIKSGGRTIAYLQVIYDMKKEYFFITALFMLMAVADAAGIIISIFAGLLISRRMLRPIDRITRTAKKISISDLNSKIDVGEADDELARLAVTFNEMISRLRNSFERQNRFVSDASHELRTPIAIIQGYAGLIDRWGKNDVNVLDESIKAIKNETESMTLLIERLLFLARGDSNQIKLQIEKFDVEDLVDEVVCESRLIAGSHKLEYSVEEKIELAADKKLIKQMLRALIDNGLKFTPPDGLIEVRAYRKPGQTVFEVRDNGVGIPEEVIRNVFDRFYMADKARSKEGGGSGLGLSIVKWIMESHDGTISAESPLGGGTVVTAKFPDDHK